MIFSLIVDIFELMNMISSMTIDISPWNSIGLLWDFQPSLTPEGVYIYIHMYMYIYIYVCICPMESYVICQLCSYIPSNGAKVLVLMVCISKPWAVGMQAAVCFPAQTNIFHGDKENLLFLSSKIGNLSKKCASWSANLHVACGTKALQNGSTCFQSKTKACN